MLLEHSRHFLDVGIKREFGYLSPCGTAAFCEFVSVPVKARGEDLDCDFGRIATGLPVAVVGLVDLGEVGKCGNIEVILKIHVAFQQILSSNAGVLFLGLFEINLPRRALVEEQTAHFWVKGFTGCTNGVRPLRWYPCSFGNHLALSECSSLVRADISHGSQRFQGVYFSDNDILLNHSLGTCCHRHCKYDSKRGWNHCKSSCNCVNDDLSLIPEVIGRQHHDSKDDRDEEQQNRKL